MDTSAENKTETLNSSIYKQTKHLLHPNTSEVNHLNNYKSLI